MTRNTYHFQMVAHKLEGKNNKVCRAVKARGFWSPGHISPHIFSKKNLSLSLSQNMITLFLVVSKQSYHYTMELD